MFANLDHEIWLAGRIRCHGIDVFSGVTDRAQRKERMREAILSIGSQVLAGRDKGKPVTLGEAFERLFDEPLKQPATILPNSTGHPNVQSVPAETEAVG